MATVYTRLLGAGSATGQLTVAAFVAQTTGTTVLRDILLSSSLPTAPFSIYVLSGSLYWKLSGGSAGDGTNHLELRQVIPAGAEVRIDCSGDLWSYAFTGYVFDS